MVGGEDQPQDQAPARGRRKVAGSAGPATVSIPSAFNPNVRVPYVIQYNATVERQIANTAISLSFVSTGARQVVYSQDINQPVASTALYINKPRPYPNYPGISYH